MTARCNFSKKKIVVLIGIVAGIIGGGLGLGGGVILVPLLADIIKLDQHKAHGTSLAAILVTGIWGTLTYSGYGSIEWRLSSVIAISAIFFAFVGAYSTKFVSRGQLKRIFGIFLIAVSLLMLSFELMYTSIYKTFVFQSSDIYKYLLIGALTGIVSGGLGVGGGTVLVPILSIAFNIDQHFAQGSSLFVMIPTAGVGAFTHYKLRQVEVKIVPVLWVGIIVGVIIGSLFAHSIPSNTLRVIFSVALVIIGLKYTVDKRSH